MLIAGYSLAFTSVWLWLIVLIFLAVIVGTYFYYRRTNPMLTRGLRITFGILRGLALTALFFVFAEPLLVVKHTDNKQPTIAIVVDNSVSMAQNRNSAEQFKAINDLCQGHLRQSSADNENRAVHAFRHHQRKRPDHRRATGNRYR